MRKAFRFLARRRRSILRALCATFVCLALTFAVLWHVCPFPIDRLEAWPSSPVVTDRTGQTLLATVGRDEQWRFPRQLAQFSPQLILATIAVEDERFFEHSGVDTIAIARAIGQDLMNLRTVSGASTLTMQICRMLDDRPRTWRAKLVESFRALQLETLQSKQQILETYLNLAPYGGNIRGAEAASLHWFNKQASDLSLPEAALLAGLPQSPSRYRPDLHPERAFTRRQHTLHRMQEVGFISAQQAAAAGEAPIGLVRRDFAPAAPQAAWLAVQRRARGGRLTIDPSIQRELEQTIADSDHHLPRGTQTAAVVIDINRSEIVAMIGSADTRDLISGQVNGATAPRSPGSALKPFIYAAAFETGRLGPDSTVYDVPINRAGWRPANFDGRYAGELSAADALRRSLNVPAILVAEQAGLARCLGVIESVGIRLPKDVQARGGLSVVVGGTEVSLLDLTNGYATLGRGGIQQNPRLFVDENTAGERVLQAETCRQIDDVLSCRNRQPRGLLVASAPPAWFMWKTGTSSGLRDAWAVGHNHGFAIGVWIGRFSGAGSPGLIGAEAAEPLLARCFQSPALRREGDPPPVPRVTRPDLPLPVEMRDHLRITFPLNQSEIMALGETATIRAQATRSEGVTWFLNGTRRTLGESFDLVPGTYELRCVNRDGEHDAIRFRVRGFTSSSAPPQALSSAR